MQYLSQRDPRWAQEKLGTCNTTFIGNGCFLVSLGMLFGIDPRTLNKLLIDQCGYFQGCNIDAPRVAKIAGYSYKKLSPSELYKTEFPLIGETDHYRSSGVPQHFFVLLSPTQIIDPLDLVPAPKRNPYNLISLRQFKSMMTKQEVQAMVYAAIGHNLPDDQVEYYQNLGAEKFITFLVNHPDFQKHTEKVQNGFECLEGQSFEVNSLKEKIEKARNILNN